MKTFFCRSSGMQLPLVHGCLQAPFPISSPASVNLELQGCTPVSDIKKKTPVRAGMLLGTHPLADKGDLFSPIDGMIADINSQCISITAAELPEEMPPLQLPPFPDKECRGSELAAMLKAYGIDTGLFTAPCDTLIINGFNPDPSILWAEGLLASDVETLREGANMLRRLSPARELLLAVPRSCRVTCEPLQTRTVASETYPISLDALVVHAITGKEAPDGVRVASLHALWGLGRVAKTARPLTETVLTVVCGGTFQNLIVPDGTPPEALLDHMNECVCSGDMLIRNGAFRGEALSDIECGINKSSCGLLVVDKGSVLLLEGTAPCVTCGRCIEICPARLNPGSLSRYMECGLLDKCREYGIDACLRCGLCTYVCRARRPVMQYLDMARHKLASCER